MRLKEIKEEKGLTNRDLAEITGVSIRTIEDIIKRGDCRVSTAKKIATGLEVSLDELCKEGD